MSVFANSFSSYLNYTANYSSRLNFLESIFGDAFRAAKDPKFISVDFINKLDEFPKFPYFMNIISGTNNIKITFIYKTCLDNPKYLLESMLDSNTIYLKTNYDTIPNEIEDILKHSNFQYTYLSTVDQIYDMNKIYKTLSLETTYRNFFINMYSQKYKAIGYPNSAGLENSCMINEQAILTLLQVILPTTCNLSDKLLRYILYFNNLSGGGIEAQQLNKQNFQQTFNTFITNNSSDMSDDIIELITKSIYNYNKLASSLRTDLIGVVNPRFFELSQKFTDYLDSLINFQPSFDLVSNFVDTLYYLCSVDLTSLSFCNPEIIDQPNSNALAIEEDGKYTKYIEKVDSLNLQQYLFLVYIYKFWPMKFLNILQMVLKEYTQDIIKTADENDNSFTSVEYLEYMTRLYAETYTPGDIANPFRDAKISYDNLYTFLAGLFTLVPNNYLWKVENAKEVSRFICELYYIQLLDNFIASDFYINFVRDLLQDIFEYLRDNGHVDYTFNWYNNHEVVDIYLKIFLRYRIFSEDGKGPGTRLFHGITANFKTIFDRVIFNLTGEPVYDIVINLKTAKEMNDQFKHLINNDSFNKIHQFNENSILSSLTCEIFYAVLGKFFS